MSNKPEYNIFDPSKIPFQEISDSDALVKEPLVSAKMITYNHAPYIAQAIEGVLQQETNFPFELVIGEDCSTDGTRAIVFGYQKKYPDIIRVIASDKNVGAHKNSIRVDKACRGKYIAYCDGDDYWHHPYKLQKQVEYMEKHPECGLVYSDYDVYDVRSKKGIKNYNQYIKRKVPQNPTMCAIVEGKAGILTCTVMVQTNLLNQIVDSDPYLHQSGRFLMGDTPRWAEISRVADIFYIEDSLATRNLLIESASRSKDPRKRLQFWISNTEMCLYLCDKHGLPRYIKEEHEKLWLRKSLQLAFIEKRHDLAELVRNKSPKLSIKDWFWYQGTKTPLMRPVVLVLQFLFQRGK